MAGGYGGRLHFRQRAASGERNRPLRGVEKPAGARVIVGRDPRFLGETFCSIAAEILAAHGITPLVIADAAPTPAIAYAVIHEQADGAINFTASHNPPEYNGIKFSTPDGAPALPEATERIEAEIAAFDGRKRLGPVPRAKLARSHSIPVAPIWRGCGKSSISRSSRKPACASS